MLAGGKSRSTVQKAKEAAIGATSALKERAAEVYQRLKKAYPDAHCELDFRSPEELLVATILSAQCTDARVNMVTPAVFARYRSARDYAEANPAELEELIKSTGFFRQKAKGIIGAMKQVVDLHGGKVPEDMESLTSLPSVGRKTANVILGNAFGIPGFPVDTHVTRLSNRIGLSDNTDPVKIEEDLTGLFAKRCWTMASHLLIFHGRRVCHARKPNCRECTIVNLCDYPNKTL